MKAELAPITDADIPAVAAFLNQELNARVSTEAWIAAITPPWRPPVPDHGFMLTAGGEVVGAYLAFYSERRIDGRTLRFCNLAAWCVREQYRFQSLKLLRALLAQEGFEFTDLSPSGNVVPLNTRLGFEFLDTTTAVLPNLPWPSWPGRVRIASVPEAIRRVLSGPELAIYADHEHAAAAHHVVLHRGDESCYVIFRRDRRKDLPLFASVLYVSDPALLRRWIRPFTRHLLLRHRLPVTLVEPRVAGYRPRWARYLSTPRRKMYKSADLGPQRIDNLYSELVCVPW